MRARSGLTLAVVGLVGCTLLTSVDDLKVADEAPSPPIAEAGDAGVEPPLPVRADADAPETGPVPFCNTFGPSVFVCDDFDQGQTLDDRWIVYTTGTGTAVVGDGGLSEPNALHLAYPGGGSFRGAALQKRLVASPSQIDVVLSIWVEESGTPPFDLVTFQRGAYEFGFEVRTNGTLYFDSDRPNLEAGTGTISEIFVTDGAIPSGRWVPVRFVVTVASDKASTEIFVDGASVAARDAPRPTFGPDALLTIGDDGMMSSPTGWRVKIDNVAVTTK